MSKLVRFPNLREAREEASAWVARIDRGLTTEERAALREWAASPLNRRTLREMSELWNDLDTLKALAEILPRETPVRGTGAGGGAGSARWLAAAAAVGCAVLGALLWLRREPAAPAVAAVTAPAPRTLETPVGESRTVALEDGSAVTLNTDTQVSVAYSAARRDLRLARGEAHFKVAHDEAKPFRVHVAGHFVEAVGTAFSVRLREGGALEVLVTEGTVRVAADADRPAAPAQMVTAQHLLQLDGAGRPRLTDVAPGDMDVRLAWQRGMLVFQGEALPEVLAEFDRYTRQQLVIADPRLRAVRVGGYFRAGDVDALLLALTENFNIRHERGAQGQILLTAAD